jgi:hypothetical protein
MIAVLIFPRTAITLLSQFEHRDNAGSDHRGHPTFAALTLNLSPEGEGL